MKILVATEMSEAVLHELRALGTCVDYEPGLTGERLAERIQDTAILVVGRLRVSAEAIHRGAKLQMIVRAGTSVGDIAVEEASAQGVFVTRCPSRTAIARAEFVFGLLVALDRQFVAAASGQRRRSGEPCPARGLSGATLGLLGFGPTGIEIAQRATAFGMKVLAWAPDLTPEQVEPYRVEYSSWPRELLRRCDMVVILATPAADEDRVVDAELIQNLRDGAYLVYFGQAARIDLAALVDLVQTRGVRCGLDFTALEPGREAQLESLIRHPGVLVTHRLAEDTQQARDAIAEEVVRIIKRFLVAGEVLHCVNLVERSPATWQLVLRLRDAVGVLAAVMDVVRADGINAEEITTRVFSGAKAAWCTIALDERPSMESLAAIKATEGVLHMELRAVV